MGWLKIKYQIYIFSPAWTEKKRSIWRLYQEKGWAIECSRCSSSDSLQLHHNYYLADLDCAGVSDLDWLCSDCHAIIKA